MAENCSVIFYARDGCESFYTAKTHLRHRVARLDGSTRLEASIKIEREGSVA